MKNLKNLLRAAALMALVNCRSAATAQEVLIPDPGLNAAVRQSLNKPTGPLSRQDLLALRVLNAHGLNISNLAGLEAALNLNTLLLFSNQITNYNLPTLTNLVILDLSANSIASISLPAGMSNLFSLLIGGNRLTSLTLPPGLVGLEELGLHGNQLAQLTLPPDMTGLFTLDLDGNPLTQLVLSQTEASHVPGTVATLQNQGIPVFTYPSTVRLTLPQEQPVGAFRFGITGPPGVYAVYASSNLTDWAALNFVNNPLGSVLFLDPVANLSPRKFYRVSAVTPPANMVFVPANTFTLGSPANETGHQDDEGPQTVVELTHGFWMGKYEVSQAEYLAVTGANPSGFPGDLTRPVESVSFFAASNYCVLLTQQELAAGRIPPGSHYRLPTEAEWECAARAGTTNRFYYGDDPALSDLSNHAWFGAHDGITTHPVGQKLPNAWGLYDMEGNVWEWCQDWYGSYPGGGVIDPQGPATNPTGWKVIRGGAWESSELECRSASRWFEPASPFISDFIIGFRVVLATDGQ